MKKSLFDFPLSKLAEELVSAGFKKYNSTQIFEWIYQKRVFDFSQMTNLSVSLKEELDANFTLHFLDVITKKTSSDGTTKFLFSLSDTHSIETVLMTHDYGLSLCVTSQVGCNMGCTFCASGLKKKIRNLSVGEMVSQIVTVENLLGIKITHIVVMGTGEPFDNYDNVIDFIKVVNENHGLAIGQRHITVSTCGIVPRIYQYSKEPIRSNLAISLHAPNDELRNQLMPINKRYPLQEIITACESYFNETSRRITFEYILLKGINDENKHADELSDLLRGLNAYVNLIPYNVVDEFTHQKTELPRAMAFYDRLTKRGIVATLRKEQGSDINAACGQLRLKSEGK